MKKTGLFAAGLVMVTAGMALTISQWATLAQVVTAFSGPVLAVGGLVLLFSASTKGR